MSTRVRTKNQINTIRPNAVVILFASKTTALFSVKFSPIIPEPTTIRSKNEVPIVSENKFIFILIYVYMVT